MKDRSWFQKVVTSVAGMALIVGQIYVQPQTVAAAENSQVAPPRDVELNKEGLLIGKISDKLGVGAAAVPVEIRQGQVLFASTRTDAQGQFTVGALRGGVYQVSVAKQPIPVRVWAQGTAPPSAIQEFVVNTGMIARGQGCTTPGCTGECGGTCDACCGGRQRGIMGLLLNPIVIGAAIAAAIAIPLALDDNDDAS